MWGVMYFILLLVEAICCLLLLAVILVQRSKGQGMGVAFGSGMGEAIFGSQMGNVLTKVTVILGIVFLVNTTVLAMLSGHRSRGSVTEKVPVPVASAAVPSDLPSGDASTSSSFPVSSEPADLPSAAVPSGSAAPVDVPAAANSTGE